MSDLFIFSYEAIALSGLTSLVLREIILATIPSKGPVPND